MLNVLIKERTQGLEVKTMDTDTMCTTDTIREDEFFIGRAEYEDGLHEELDY